MSDRIVTMFELDRPCPKCGARLISDGRTEFCGRQDRPGIPACDYGVSEVVPLGEGRAAP